MRCRTSQTLQTPLLTVLATAAAPLIIASVTACGGGNQPGGDAAAGGPDANLGCAHGAARCAADGQGYQACGSDPDTPAHNTFGPRLPCAPDSSCSATTGRCERNGCLNAEVMLLLDRSSNMLANGTWNWVKQSLVDTLPERASANHYGLRQFPAEEKCSVGAVVDMALDNAVAIENAIIDPGTASATPIQAVLEGLSTHYGDPNDGQAVVLITNGGETCGDPKAAIAAASALWRVGIQVHVVAVTATANRAFLDRVARAGGTTRSELTTNRRALDGCVI